MRRCTMKEGLKIGMKEGLLQMSAYKRGACSNRMLIGLLKIFFGLIYSRDIATLQVDCRDTDNSKKNINVLTMTFSLPYFLLYQGKITTSGSVKPSSVRNNTGQLVFQVGKRSISE